MRGSARIFLSSASSADAACASCLLRRWSRIFIRNAMSSFALWYASTSFFVSRSTSRSYAERRFAAAAFSSSSRRPMMALRASSCARVAARHFSRVAAASLALMDSPASRGGMYGDR